MRHFAEIMESQKNRYLLQFGMRWFSIGQSFQKRQNAVAIKCDV